MVDPKQRTRLVGTFIRQRREAIGLSQRALGLLFTPAVTTQFISNVERGVTPLPPAHVPTLARALQVSDADIMSLLEREYSAKLSGRLGRDGQDLTMVAQGLSTGANDISAQLHALSIDNGDYPFMRNLYDAWRKADGKTRQAFATVCESMLNVPRASSPSVSEAN